MWEIKLAAFIVLEILVIALTVRPSTDADYRCFGTSLTLRLILWIKVPSVKTSTTLFKTENNASFRTICIKGD